MIVFGECLVDWIDECAIPGGAPFNVARHLAGLGLEPYFVTRLGEDAHGRLLRAELARCGLSEAGVQADPLRPSGQVIVRAGPQGHGFEILPDQAYDHIAVIATAQLPARYRDPHRPPWLYHGTLAQRASRSRESLQRLRASLVHRSFVDLNWREGHVAPELAQDAAAHADWLKLSADELVLLLRWAQRESPYAHALPPAGARCPAIGAVLGQRPGARCVVTHGAAGYALWDGLGQCRLSGPGTRPEAIVDTVGAGDAFSAITLAGLVLGWSEELALARANDFAGAICTVRGAVPADPGFHAAWRHRWGLRAPR